MQPIFRFKAFRHTIPALAAGLLCAAFSPDNDPDTYRVNTIREIMKRIGREHYQPKPLDDRFSGTVWKKFLEAQDPHKLLLLRADVEMLRQWESRVDDELRDPAISFFRGTDSLLSLRIRQVMPLFRGLMAKPLDFSAKESASAENTAWPANAKEQRKAWEKFLKLHVLRKMVELRNADPALSLAEAEKQARKKVLSWLNTTYNNMNSATAGEQRFAAYVNTVVMEIDPHTMYYAPADNRDRNAHMAQRYYGVGMELEAEDGDVRVKRLLPGGAADRSGLVKAYDQVVAVGNINGEMTRVSGLSVLDVSRLIRGDSGTVLKMLIGRGGREEEIRLTRAEIKDNSSAAKSAFIERNGKKFGYIRLPEFYRDFSRPDGPQCSMDVAKAMQQMMQEQVAGVIIDLRGNGGGSLEEVQKMMGLFVPSGPVTVGRFKDKNTRFDLYPWPGLYYDGPMTIMVDESSASASEMFSGAMQDYGRAVIVGSASSFGKGTMQETRQMGKLGNKKLGTPNISYGMLNITLGRFYRITGASTQLNGVRPDVVFPGKGDWSSFREKNFTSAWAPDSIEAAGFVRSKHAAALPAAIAAAKKRVLQDTGFAAIRESADWLKAHDKDMKPLQLAAFMENNAIHMEWERRIDSSARLPAFAAMDARLIDAPPADPIEATRLRDWLENLKADRYVEHAARVVEDLSR